MAQPIYKFFMGRFSRLGISYPKQSEEGFGSQVLTRLLKKQVAHIGNRTLEDRLLAELHVLGNHTAALQQLGAPRSLKPRRNTVTAESSFAVVSAVCDRPSDPA